VYIGIHQRITQPFESKTIAFTSQQQKTFSDGNQFRHRQIAEVLSHNTSAAKMASRVLGAATLLSRRWFLVPPISVIFVC
jgi:hypothetical protein